MHRGVAAAAGRKCAPAAPADRGLRFTAVATLTLRPRGQLILSLQISGHGPTKQAGADVYWLFESTAQRISTGRPSQPQRPPGSMQAVVLLGTTQLLNLSPRNPQRLPEGHSASLLHAKDGFDGRVSVVALLAATLAVCGRVLLHGTTHRISVSNESLSTKVSNRQNAAMSACFTAAEKLSVDPFTSSRQSPAANCGPVTAGSGRNHSTNGHIRTSLRENIPCRAETLT